MQKRRAAVMMPQAQWHPSITVDRVAEAVTRRMTTLDNPGFCLGCGEEAMGCEPDARAYECESCGDPLVYGADEIALVMI
jgi:hypothetical protein